MVTWIVRDSNNSSHVQIGLPYSGIEPRTYLNLGVYLGV